MKKWLYGVGFTMLAAICVAMNFLLYTYFYPNKFSAEIALASSEFSVDQALICAVVNVESSFDSTAVSRRGAKGLMQIMPATAESIAQILDEPYSEESLFDVETNLRYGAYYLHYLQSQFDFDEAICAYNAGIGKVKTWLKDAEYSSNGEKLDIIPYGETREYLTKVKKNYNYYKNKY